MRRELLLMPNSRRHLLQIGPEAKYREAQVGFLGRGQGPVPCPPPSPGLPVSGPLTIAGLAITVQGEALAAGAGVGARGAEAHLLAVMVACGAQV